MRHAPLMIAAGAAAVMGGTLRIVAMFTAGVFSAETLQYLYFVIDVFLMLGLSGWYVSRADKLGGAGLIGFVVSVVAILAIRSIDLFGASNYVLGAGLLLAGLAVMNAPTLLRRDGARLAPALWLAALASAVPGFALGAVDPHFAALTAVAALLFGSGFVAAGAALLRIGERP